MLDAAAFARAAGGAGTYGTRELSANVREILDSRSLFESKFEKARDKHHEIKG